MKKRLYVIISILLFCMQVLMNINASSQSSGQYIKDHMSACNQCSKFQQEILALQNRIRQLQDDLMKYIKMYSDAREECLSAIGKWVGIATGLAEKLIGHAMKVAKM